MQLSTYHDIVYRTINADCPGYGYLEVFANALYSHREELNIGNVLVYYKLEVNNNSKEFFSFVNNLKFNTDCFKLADIANQDRVIDSTRQDIKSFKNSSEFGTFHVIAFPIHPAAGEEKLFGFKGVVLLISHNRIGISPEDQDQLCSILCTKKPKTMECPQVSKAIKRLVRTEERMCDISLKHRYTDLVATLNILANKGDIKNSAYGLRHFSFWSSNNLEKSSLCKEFSQNTYGYFSHDITYRGLEGQQHFILDYFNFYTEHENDQFRKLIKLFNYDDIENSLYNSDDYFPNIGLTKDNTSVIIIPLNFDSHVSFCCFYIKDIIFTPFVSITLFRSLGDAIKQRIDFTNEINIKNMLDEMMGASFKFFKSTDFFNEITTILTKSNEAIDCLIYLKNDTATRFLLVSEEDENNTSTIHESNMRYGDYEFYLPSNIKSDTFVQSSICQALQTQTSACFYSENSGLFRSICVVIIKDANNLLCGFILLLGKHHMGSYPGSFFNNMFFYNNIYIVESCSKYLLLYLSFIHSNNRKTRLLRKLRHEIPDCLHVIDKDIIEINNNINTQDYRVNKLQMRVNEVLMNTRRIDNIVSFFSTADSNDNRFLAHPHLFNMHDFINERLELFKEEAALRGVSIKCDIDMSTPELEVGNYYPHALSNIIINAIRYAAPGTCICVRSNSEGISISDIGIQIKDSEMEKIFSEGYRSDSAKQVNERGMGYGLYLVKRILDAHEHSINVSCDFVFDRNIFVETMVYHILSTFSPEERKEYILIDTFPGEENDVWRQLERIKKSELLIPNKYRSYINNDINSSLRWFEYHRTFGPTFYSMEEDYFSQPLYNVTFSIIFPR